MHARIAALALIAGLAPLAAARPVARPISAPTLPPLAAHEVVYTIDSGYLPSPAGGGPAVIFTTEVADPGSSWLRLKFSAVELGGDIAAGTGAMLRITSALDGAVMLLNAESVRQWYYTSAYFNGDTVTIELIAHPGTGLHRVGVGGATAGDPVANLADSICGPTDDRQLSNDPRSARMLPVGCSAWLIDDKNHQFITAGHCGGNSGSPVMQFNVPLSTAGGALVNPPPSDQYSVDTSSHQGTNGGVGNDWGYLGVFPNSTTGKRPFEKQGAFYRVALTAPAVAGQNIRITGYGTTSSPVSPTWTQVQKTHTGPFTATGNSSGAPVQYRTDTTGGNSGSCVHDTSSDMAIGVHTHGGCTSSGGANSGTGIGHVGLRAALAAPRGVCIPTLATCYADCDKNGVLNVNDFTCFQTKFALSDPWANCDGNVNQNAAGTQYTLRFDVNDYICYQTKFALGCP